MQVLAERFDALERIASTAADFVFPGGSSYTGPIRPVGIICQNSNDSRPIPKRRDRGCFQYYLVLAEHVPLECLGPVDGSEPYRTGIVLAMLNDEFEFLDWSPATGTIGMLQTMGIPWCSDGSMDTSCAESSGGRFSWDILFKPAPNQPKRIKAMIECKVCGNKRIADSETMCPDCGTLVGSPSAAAAPQPVAPAVMRPAPPAPQPSPVAPTPVASPTSGTVPAEASLTIFRGGALTNEKISWSGRLVVVGKFDIDEGPVDVDLSQIPEAGYVSRRHCQVQCDAANLWTVKDLGSSNGTFVRPAGTQKFQKIGGDQPIKDGDELALGNARFVFHTGLTHA